LNVFKTDEKQGKKKNITFDLEDLKINKTVPHNIESSSSSSSSDDENEDPVTKGGGQSLNK